MIDRHNQERRRSAITTQDDEITLHLEGSRAVAGVTLADFENFIDHFLGALRDFDRDRRGVQTRKEGPPEGRARTITAFRMVRFREGSGIATIVPDLTPAPGEALFDERPPQTENLEALLEEYEAGQLPAVVSESLGMACGSLGENGSITVKSPGRATPFVIDAGHLQRAHPGEVERVEVESISGRLHLLDVEPEKLAIRASNGVDWVCSYPEELAGTVKHLVDTIVWVSGKGEQLSPKRGTMQIADVRPVIEGTQDDFFSVEAIPDDQLMKRQGIRRPQGIERVSGEDWDAEADQAYLAALIDA